jgi:predicted small secreted protein
MLDAIFIGVIIAFFLLALAYLAACNSLREGATKE